MSVCVSDHTVPQKLDTPGLPFLACIQLKGQEQALANIFSTILEAIKKSELGMGSFSLPRLFLHLTKHEFYITGCLNDSSFQQESLNMYTSKVIKLTKVS